MDGDTHRLRNPWFTVGTLFYGLFVLYVLLIVAAVVFGAGIGTVELGVWLALALVWVVAWIIGRRRDPGVIDHVRVEHNPWFTVSTLLYGLLVLLVLLLVPALFGGAFGIGSAEITVWFALAVIWAIVWA